MILILLLFFLSSCIKNLFFLPPPHKIIFSSKINLFSENSELITFVVIEVNVAAPSLYRKIFF